MHTATAGMPQAPGEPATRALERGACLGSYELVLPIASGGMGRVWIAARRGDFGFERMFAVKVMREELAKNASFRRMFLDEAKLAARLRHTNVVEVVDLGEALGNVYQAMALVDGDSLSGLRALSEAGDRHIAPEIAGRIIADVLRGLHAAHQLSDEDGLSIELVHRDVSPQNILVGLDGVSKIADFGVARAVGSIGITTGPVGKRSYMAPEQLAGNILDRRCDVFAAGVVLWELLAGKRAPRIATILLDGRSIEHPCSVRPEAHPGLADIAMRALAIHPENRFATADAMADAIEEAAVQSGLTLSNKRVGAWVSELVGPTVSRQREQARREFEQTHASLLSRETDTIPQSAFHRNAHLATSDPLSAAVSAPAATSTLPKAWRGLRRVQVFALVVIATLSSGAVWVSSRKAPVTRTVPAPSAHPRDTDSVASVANPAGSSNPSSPLPAGTAASVTSSTAHRAENQARSSVARPRAGARSPAKAGGKPSLPYDNPYMR